MDDEDKFLKPDETQIRSMLNECSVPVLLMVVYQFTGDPKWLTERYAPKRSRGIEPHMNGGLSGEVTEEILEAAVPVVAALLRGEAPVIAMPAPHKMTQLASFFLGEHVDPRYGPMLHEEIIRRALPSTPLGNAAPVWLGSDSESGRGRSLKAIVIGAGVTGIGAMRMLQELGIEFTVFEKAPESGGVWYQNRYPGAGVDTPSHLYNYGFRQGNWSSFYALRDELFDYFHTVLKELNVAERIKFGHQVLSATYDDDTCKWTVVVRDADGDTVEHTADVVLSAVGALNVPKKPNIEGLEEYGGEQIHSNEWPNIDLSGRRVAIVGTGASSQQIAPEIAPEVESLTIFQRTPQWVAPFVMFRVQVPEGHRFLLDRIPLYRVWNWISLFWQHGDVIIQALRVDPTWEHLERSVSPRNDGQRKFLTRYMEQQLAGREDLLAKALPTYPPFGKRMLLDNGWFRALRRDNVQLVAEAVLRADKTGLVSASGDHYDADVIVWATGFQATHFLSSIDVRGAGGVTLSEYWDYDDPRSLLGISVPRFPNFFILGGPHSLPGSGSFMYILELQIRYVGAVLSGIIEKGLTAVAATEEAADRYTQTADELHERTVWAQPGFETYYRNSKGRVVFISPFMNVEFWEFAREPKWEDLRIYPGPAE